MSQILIQINAQIRIEKNREIIFPKKNKNMEMKIRIKCIKPVSGEVNYYWEVTKLDKLNNNEKFLINVDLLYNIKKLLINEGRITLYFKELLGNNPNIGVRSGMRLSDNNTQLENLYVICFNKGDPTNLEKLIKELVLIKSKKTFVVNKSLKQPKDVIKRDKINFSLKNLRNLNLIINISQFLEKKEKLILRRISKKFDKLICCTVKTIIIKKSMKIPYCIFKKLVNKFSSLEELSINENNWLIQSFKVYNYLPIPTVKKINIYFWSKQHNKNIIKLCYLFPNLRSLSINYSSISSDLIFLFINSFKYFLNEINLCNEKNKNRYFNNKDITELSIFKLLKVQYEVRILKLYKISDYFIDYINKGSPLKFLKNIKVLKIKFIILKEKNLEDLCIFFKNFINLEYLEIENIDFNNLIIDDNLYLNLLECFYSLKKLFLGSWFDNKFLINIFENNRNLEYFGCNNDISDVHLIYLFKYNLLIKKIKIENCEYLNGHCFEHLKSIDYIMLKFDDYRFKQLNKVLNNKRIRPRLKRIIDK